MNTRRMRCATHFYLYLRTTACKCLPSHGMVQSCRPTRTSRDATHRSRCLRGHENSPGCYVVASCAAFLSGGRVKSFRRHYR